MAAKRPPGTMWQMRGNDYRAVGVAVAGLMTEVEEATRAEGTVKNQR